MLPPADEPVAPRPDVPPGARPLGVIHADALARDLARLRREVLAAAARVACRVVRGRAFVRSGCRDLEQYASEELLVSARTLRRLAALGAGLSRLRPLESAFFGADGAPPVAATACSVIGSAASPATAAAWIATARAVSYAELCRLARAARAAGSSAVPAHGARERRRRTARSRPVPAVDAPRDGAGPPLDLRDALEMRARAERMIGRAGTGTRDDALAQIRDLLGSGRDVTVVLAGLLACMDEAAAWPRFGWPGFASYAEIALGIARSTAHDLLRLGRVLRASDGLATMVRCGAASFADALRL